LRYHISGSTHAIASGYARREQRAAASGEITGAGPITMTTEYSYEAADAILNPLGPDLPCQRQRSVAEIAGPVQVADFCVYGRDECSMESLSACAACGDRHG
jgi:hypothetical protein